MYSMCKWTVFRGQRHDQMQHLHGGHRLAQPAARAARAASPAAQTATASRARRAEIVTLDSSPMRWEPLHVLVCVRTARTHHLGHSMRRAARDASLAERMTTAIRLRRVRRARGAHTNRESGASDATVVNPNDTLRTLHPRPPTSVSKPTSSAPTLTTMRARHAISWLSTASGRGRTAATIAPSITRLSCRAMDADDGAQYTAACQRAPSARCTQCLCQFRLP